MSGQPPTAFISYSWDDEDHKIWVLALAERLVENGVAVRLDRWDVAPGASLTEFMERSLRDCGFCVVVCTPNYASRANGRKGGVGYEQQIISGAIAAGVERAKFIPIIRSGSFDPADQGCALPTHFLGVSAIDFRGAQPDVSFEDLLRAIFRKPRLTPPELGRRPAFADSEQGNVRLASLEVDGWTLASGVLQNELTPTTFYLPSEAARRAVPVGYFVKITFEIADDDEEEETGPFAERMWVEVTGTNGPYYVGRLRNQPSSFVYIDPDDEKHFVDPEAPLKVGDEIIFLPEHVINILGPEDEDA